MKYHILDKENLFKNKFFDIEQVDLEKIATMGRLKKFIE